MEKPLKVGIVCHPTFGGSGVVASELGLALADRGHKVHFFSHVRPIRLVEQERTFFHEVDVTSYPLFKYPPYALALATKLAETCKSDGIDILHAHYAIPHAISAYLCRKMIGGESPLLITTLHGTDITLVGLDPSFFEITRFSILESDGVTAVSDHLARRTEEIFDISRPVKVIPNFVDTNRFSPDKKDPALRSNYAMEYEALIGHVSNFRAVKRVHDVVRVFHKVVHQVPARLLLVGDGPEKEPVRTLVAELGIQEKVSFLGTYKELPSLLAQLDLFVLPSEQESFGLAALEAMSCAVPVIATRVGGLGEVVEEGKTGFTFSVGDTEAMAHCAVEVLRQKDLLRSLGMAARKRAHDLFPQERIVDLYEAYYREILDAPRFP